MSSLLLIVLSAVLVNLAVLASVPAWRPFVAVSSVFEAARGLSIAGFIVIPPAVVLSWLLAAGPLTAWGLDYLRTPAVVAVVLLIVPLAELALRRPPARLLPQQPGFTLLMAANAAVLGAALFALTRLGSALSALLAAVGIASALGALTLAFAALYERQRQAQVPASLRDAPLALVTAGIAALACMGLSGLIRE